MAHLRFAPLKHDHPTFLAKASAREGFNEVYDALELEYRAIDQLLKARAAFLARSKTDSAPARFSL